MGVLFSSSRKEKEQEQEQKQEQDQSSSTMSLEKVKQIVNSAPVVVFSKTYCGYCNRVKQLLSELGATYKSVELDVENDGDEIQSTLMEWTGQRTVPNVFINKKHIGGCDSMFKFIRLSHPSQPGPTPSIILEKRFSRMMDGVGPGAGLPGSRKTVLEVLWRCTKKGSSCPCLMRPVHLSSPTN